MVDDIKKHCGHEIVDQYVLVNGKQEWFKYCRTCKVEVETKVLYGKSTVTINGEKYTGEFEFETRDLNTIDGNLVFLDLEDGYIETADSIALDEIGMLYGIERKEKTDEGFRKILLDRIRGNCDKIIFA